MRQSFRFQPTTAAGDHIIARPRLTVALADRFEHRLTTIVAPAGCGKTTALAQASQNNALAPLGEDIWLCAGPADAEPATLVSGILGACGAVSSGDIEADRRALCELLWSRAPMRVTLIVDDAHHLSQACAPVLSQLLQDLPANVQLLLSGRSCPALSVARLRSLRQVLEVTQHDLALDDDEARMLIAARGSGDVTTLPRHVASADLTLSARTGTTSDYLWEEVLGQIDKSRLDALVMASVLDEIDDPLARAISAESFTAASLTAGLPMVETHPSGNRRMHTLLREALGGRLGASDRAGTLRKAATVELERGRLAEACDLLVRAGDPEQAVDAARELVVLPTLSIRTDDTRSVRRSIAAVAPDSALHQLLDGHCNLNLPADRLTAMFEEVAAAAQLEDDGLIEAVATFRAIQAANNGDAPLPPAAVERVRRLAPDIPFAGAAYAYLESLRHQAEGDSAAAVLAMRRCGPLGAETLLALEPERFCDLGRPEMVATDLGPEDLAALPAGAEIFIAFAMWLRGELPPESALPIGLSMLPGVSTRGLTQPFISLLSVLTHIALAAGEPERARELATECAERCASQEDVRTALFGAMAMASVSSVDGDEERAAALLDPSTTGVPFGKWPARPHLLGIPLLFLSRPETRDALERCQFGTALTSAVAAGRALVELREGGSDGAASGLPWADGNVLRVHVLPHHLVELAAATTHPDAKWASARLGSTRPDSHRRVQVRALGTIELVRGGDVVTDTDWVRRVRVRELLALLVESRSISRGQAAAELWPDLAPERATNNLRVTLSRLQGVLEPDRDPDDAPSFVHSEGVDLVVDDALEIDVPRFERLLNQAHGLDRAGGPAEAIVLYQEALGLWRGPYLELLDTPRVNVTRMRLDSLARTAMVRLGELELARGEPERALSWGAAAQSTSAIDERAGRLMALAMHAMGDRAGALEAVTVLMDALDGAELEPQTETLRVLERAKSTA